jgi:hypothetical protein
METELFPETARPLSIIVAESSETNSASVQVLGEAVTVGGSVNAEGQVHVYAVLPWHMWKKIFSLAAIPVIVGVVGPVNVIE